MGLVFVQQGMPMTYQSSYHVSTLEPAAMGTDDKGQPKQQTIVVGPVAAFETIKQLGTNGGGFYGMNSAHPFENPTAWTNFLECFAMMFFPMSLVLMYGSMLKRMAHAWVIFAVMMSLMVGTIAWTVYYDTLQPNPGLTAHPNSRTFEIASATAKGGKREFTLPAVAGLPVDQHLGNLEGKELRFGTSAGATFAAMTVNVTCGAVNCEHDSLNPISGLAPFTGMFLNCIYGGKGVGMINLVLFLILGIFVAGQMVGRSPEYLGKKIGAREMKLAMIALLIHPIMILGPSGLFAATDWGHESHQQSGRPWPLGNRLPVLVGFGEQRFGLRRTWNQLRLAQQSKPGVASNSVGHRCRTCDSIQSLHPDCRSSDRDGGKSRRQEVGAIYARHAARRHAHIWFSVAGHHRHHRRAVIPAGGGAWTSGRALGADTIRRLSEPQPSPNRTVERSDLHQRY